MDHRGAIEPAFMKSEALIAEAYLQKDFISFKAFKVSKATVP